MPTLYLIDGHAYLHRAYHALPPLTTSRGEPVNAIYGFVRMLWKIVRQEKPDYLLVCFDTPAPTFRHKVYAEYKGTRKEMDDALRTQMPLAREAVKALNLTSLELDGYEADDLIAHFTRKATGQGWDVVIVSGDKDTLQLVGDKVRVLSEPKNIVYDAQKVQERYGLPPEKLPDFFALVGDASDNVPGVPGIGPKTAVHLIQEYGNLESLLKAAAAMKGKMGPLLESRTDTARKSRRLVELNADVPLPLNWVECALKPPRVDTLSPFLQRLEFYSLLDEIIPKESVPAVKSSLQTVILSSESDIKKWASQVLGEKRLALHLVTADPNPLHPGLIGIALSFKPGSAVYMPVHSHTPELLKNILNGLLSGTKPSLIGHNLKFAGLAFGSLGISIAGAFDTMVASYVLNPSRPSHALKDLVLEVLGDRLETLDALLGKGNHKVAVEQVPVESLAAYACACAESTLRLAERLGKQMKEKGLDKLFYDLEMPLEKILARMEKAGIRIDRPYLAELGKSLQARIASLEKKIYEIAGEHFNVNSPKQLSVILFEKLKLPVIRRTKTGFSTDEEVLQTLSASHPLPASLIEYRELQKLNSTYVEGLLNELAAGEERIHTTFNQTVAATGRLSSSNPNLQNIPIRTELGRQIRRAFVPESGWIFLSADYSQIDLRVLAHMTGDPALCEAFRNGQDVHTITAADIFGVSMKDVTNEMRRAAKTINFGIVYGMSPFGLSQQLQISAEQAKDYIARYFQRYQGVKTWIDSTIIAARETGYARTLLGRIRYLPEILSKNSAVRAFAERTAVNTPIQGTSADIIKQAMLHLDKAFDRKEWLGHLLVQVHDELLFEIRPQDLERSGQCIKKIMEDALPLSIPVVVDLKTGDNWAEMTPPPDRPPKADPDVLGSRGAWSGGGVKPF